MIDLPFHTEYYPQSPTNTLALTFHAKLSLETGQSTAKRLMRFAITPLFASFRRTAVAFGGERAVVFGRHCYCFLVKRCLRCFSVGGDICVCDYSFE